MDAKNIENLMAGLLQKLKNDGYSKEVISNTTWIINHFKNIVQKSILQQSQFQ